MALITLKEWAEKVGIAPATVRQRIKRGVMPAIKMGRDWFIDENTELIDHRAEGRSKRWTKEDK